MFIFFTAYFKNSFKKFQNGDSKKNGGGGGRIFLNPFEKKPNPEKQKSIFLQIKDEFSSFFCHFDHEHPNISAQHKDTTRGSFSMSFSRLNSDIINCRGAEFPFVFKKSYISTLISLMRRIF